MPRIPWEYLECSIYLYESRQSAEAGERFGGSGFLVSIRTPPIYDLRSIRQSRYTKTSVVFPPHIYAVTNKHVVEDAGCAVVRLNAVGGKWDVLELEHGDWIPHPEGDDLMVAPVDLPRSGHRFVPIDVDVFIQGGGDSTSYAVAPGDDTFMVGRFINHAGEQRNTPSLRFGSIAMLPYEKVRLQDGHMQEAFLVETRSISGYSGSPVFVYMPIEEKMLIQPDRYVGEYVESHQTSITSLIGYPKLLGIDCGHVPKYDPVLDAAGNPQQYGWKVDSNTGMAVVIPAWRLMDLLNTEDLVMQRKEKDRQYQEEKEAESQPPGVVFDVEKLPGFTKDDYQDALKRASRKISQPESESDET